MDLETQILYKHSKQNALLICEWIGNNESRFEALMLLFLNGNPKLVQRSAWVISLVGAKHANLLTPYLSLMLQKCEHPNIHDAIKRNITKTLQFIDLPKELHADIINICFDFLVNVQESIAIRCHAMSVLANLCKEYPELKQELQSVILNALEIEETSAGFKSRARMTLKKISA